MGKIQNDKKIKHHKISKLKLRHSYGMCLVKQSDMKKKILAIDDNSSICMIIRFTLGEVFELEVVQSAEEALKKLQSGFKPSLIITDLQMPTISGLDFLKNIKLSNVFKRVPVMILSGKEDSSTRIESFKHGANDFLLKPFNPEELKMRVNNLLNIGLVA